MVERLRGRGTRFQRYRLANREPARAPNGRAMQPRSASVAQRGQSIVEFALVAPLMIFLMFGIFDLGRIWTTMMSVESAAREAADFGTSFGAAKWSGGAPTDDWVAEMQRRACVAASDLPDFEWTDTDADNLIDTGEPCTNPTFAYCLIPPGDPCDPLVPIDATDVCEDPVRDPPCTVKVTLHHVFHLFVPFQIDFFGVQFGLPVSLDFDRDSTFAMTDIEVAP